MRLSGQEKQELKQVQKQLSLRTYDQFGVLQKLAGAKSVHANRQNFHDLNTLQEPKEGTSRLIILLKYNAEEKGTVVILGSYQQSNNKNGIKFSITLRKMKRNSQEKQIIKEQETVKSPYCVSATIQILIIKNASEKIKEHFLKELIFQL